MTRHDGGLRAGPAGPVFLFDIPLPVAAASSVRRTGVQDVDAAEDTQSRDGGWTPA